MIMEFIAFILAIIFVSIVSFWLTGTMYGLIHRPAIYFPISLATKMAAAAVLGIWFFGIGGIILATLIFNSQMMKRQDYNRWPTIFTGVIISLLCTFAIYFSAIYLAWGILD
jgi:hypothetical protein